MRGGTRSDLPVGVISELKSLCRVVIFFGPLAKWLRHPAHNRTIQGSSP